MAASWVSQIITEPIRREIQFLIKSKERKYVQLISKTGQYTLVTSCVPRGWCRGLLAKKGGYLRRKGGGH